MNVLFLLLYQLTVGFANVISGLVQNQLIINLKEYMTVTLLNWRRAMYY